METDLKKIENLAKKREDENWAFRSYLKGHDGKDLDSMVHKLLKKFSNAIDCTTCGNCCRVVHPILKKNDITTLSKSLKISPAQFKNEYVQTDEDGDEVFKLLPCPFLQDSRCSHYEARPSDCKSFPHIHKSDFITRLLGVIHNYSICPIVFNVYEELKKLHKYDFDQFQEVWGDYEY